MANLAEQTRRLNRGMATGFALLTDHRRVPDPLPLLAVLRPGDVVVLRHYGVPARAALAKKFNRVCKARRLTMVIADDMDLAVALGTGLHLPESRARNAGARVRLWHRQRKRTLTVAAHSRCALKRAMSAGADLALLSPVFPTASHPDARPLGGLHFRILVRGAALPVWALGGVTEKTSRILRNIGTAGIATVGNLTRG